MVYRQHRLLGSCPDIRPASGQRRPVPAQRWHFTTLSPFFNRPLPSQFLHFCFFLVLGPFSFAIAISTPARRNGGPDSSFYQEPTAAFPGYKEDTPDEGLLRIPGSR